MIGKRGFGEVKEKNIKSSLLNPMKKTEKQVKTTSAFQLGKGNEILLDGY